MTGINTYFEDNAEMWVLDGYCDSGYNYPTAFHRARIVTDFVSGLNRKKLNIVDLGSGGGDMAFYLAKKNPKYKITGIDQSQKMLNLARKRCEKLPDKVGKRIHFERRIIDDKIDLGEKFDVVTALGFIGYLESDELLFDIVGKLLKPGGCLLVSCRNRLFNMNSLTLRTIEEIKNGTAIDLIKEIEDLYVKVSEEEANKFVKKFKQIAKSLPEMTLFDGELMKSPSKKLGSYVSKLESEPRQSTPKQLKAVASRCGFEHKAYYGVHPHLMDPNLNRMLPPQIFNKMVGCLEAFEHLPISLTWSSVFIGAFQKKRK